MICALVTMELLYTDKIRLDSVAHTHTHTHIYIYIYIYIYIFGPVKPELGVIPSGQEGIQA